MSDQTQTAGEPAESQASEEVLALLGEDQSTEVNGTEEVTAETETVETDPEQEEANPTKEEAEQSEEESSENDEETKDDAEEPEKESQEFLVAGVKYTDINEAAKAINRISGDNTRLAGDVNSMKNQLQQREDELKKLNAKVAEWEKFYEEGEEGDRPDKANIDQKVREILQEERQKDKADQVKDQYRAELSDIQNEKDYSIVLPYMLQLADELGDAVQSISPKKLYRMARGVVQGDDSSEVLKTAEKLAEQKIQKQANKEKAKKIIGGNSQKSPSIVKESEVSPELEALLS